MHSLETAIEKKCNAVPPHGNLELSSGLSPPFLPFQGHENLVPVCGLGLTVRLSDSQSLLILNRENYTQRE